MFAHIETVITSTDADVSEYPAACPSVNCTNVSVAVVAGFDATTGTVYLCDSCQDETCMSGIVVRRSALGDYLLDTVNYYRAPEGLVTMAVPY